MKQIIKPMPAVRSPRPISERAVNFSFIMRTLCAYTRAMSNVSVWYDTLNLLFNLLINECKYVKISTTKGWKYMYGLCLR